jgi:Flp pilus assembly pilin Flp
VRRTLEIILADESGVTAVEYGVMVALISSLMIPAVNALGVHLKTTFSALASSL